jgi:hypothetical protein
MSAIQFKNQYVMELASDLTAGATTLTLKSGHGDLGCPAVETGQEKHFFVTLVNSVGSREIIKIIKRTSGSDILTVGSSMADQSTGNVSGRAQEGTTALAVTASSDHAVVLRLTAGIMDWVASAIPAGEIILFEKDTAALGYTLKTDVDDGLVYVTRGSAAGGETAGTSKAGSTWTQPGHTHTGPDHAHTGPSHTHDVPYGGGALLAGNTVGLNPVLGGGTYYYFLTNTATIYGTIPAAGTGNTGAAGTGDTGAGATADTWRPSGRNFTRQQRN